MSTPFNKPRILENLQIAPDKGMILTRLGYKKTVTVIDPNHQQFLDRTIKTGLLLCDAKAVFLQLDIVSNNDGCVTLEDGTTFQSKNLSSFLKDAKEVMLMAATVGSEITHRIEKEIQEGDAAVGVVLDAVASEAADATLDWLMDFINRMLQKKGIQLYSKRYSPGYGDLGLEYQKVLHALLALQKLEISITDRYLLIPEKSVIAITGIERVGSNE